MKNTKTNSSKAGRIVTVLFSMLFTVIFIQNTAIAQQTDGLEGIMFSFVDEGDANVLQPYADALSSNMNSGLFHSAKVKKGFSLYFGLQGTGTYINGDNPSVTNANKTLDILPMAIPQIQIGSLAGTEISARFLPSIRIGQYGSVGMWGFGIKHGVTSHFKNSPVDVAVGFAVNGLTIGDSKDKDLVNATSIAANLQLSKELSVFTFYTGVQYDKTSMEVKVNYAGVTTKMEYENENNLKGIVGMNIKLGPVNLNGGYSFGKTNSVNAGIGFGF